MPLKKLVLNLLLICIFCSNPNFAQPGSITISDTVKYQIIDGFGAHQSDASINQSWWNQLFYDDLECSIYRVDLTPKLVSPYSDLNCFSPWFMGSSVKSVFNFEDASNPNGPEGNRVRTYTGPNDYSRQFGGRSAPIAVMGPDIEKNIAYFRYDVNTAIQTGKQRINQLGDFKLIGSIWSPLPWVKVSSGNRYPENWWPGPVINSPWPFIWGGNFSGGRLDVSNTPLQVFNDLNLGGTGPTSSLTQFARSTAAYILGYQRFHQQKFYAISIQNELNFEVYYSSMTYPLSSQYIAAIKVVRNEFDKYPELKDIRIMGPEDLLGGDSYGMWEYGGPVHKNLQYLKNIAADPEALKALDFLCIHGYASDGVSTSGSNPGLWDWWVKGWTTSPAPGIPANVKGFSSLGKKSWMTETSGEYPDWIYPKAGFPGEGAFGVGIRIHQALTNGMESAWIYWTFTDSDSNGNVSQYGLSNQASGNSSPKFNAAKHFYKFIRPGAVRINANVLGGNGIVASAYTQEQNKKITIVILNTSANLQTTNLKLPYTNVVLNSYVSKENDYWKASTVNVSNGQANISIPAYGMLTLHGGIPSTESDPIGEISKHKMLVYPNPFVHEITVKCDCIAGDYNLEIIDCQGKIILTKILNSSISKIQFDQTIEAGLYYYKITKFGLVLDSGKIVKLAE